MGRTLRSVSDMTTHVLQPLSQTCMQCGNTARVAYHTQRTVATLHGRHYLHLIVRRCHTKTCSRYHQPYRPEEEGQWALPHGEYGLDVIALVGMLRYRHHYSLVELHQALRDRGLAIGERTVLNLLARYEELVSIHLANQNLILPQICGKVKSSDILFQKEEVRRLKRELEAVKQERDILKKAIGIFSRGQQ